MKSIVVIAGEIKSNLLVVDAINHRLNTGGNKENYFTHNLFNI